jgi:hypothetical protein
LCIVLSPDINESHQCFGIDAASCLWLRPSLMTDRNRFAYQNFKKKREKNQQISQWIYIRANAFELFVPVVHKINLKTKRG